jgi:hypothetical protein
VGAAAATAAAESTGQAAGSGGRGRSNMARRAQRLAGTLETDFGARGGRVSLRMPLAHEPPGHADSGTHPPAVP